MWEERFHALLVTINILGGAQMVYLTAACVMHGRFFIGHDARFGWYGFVWFDSSFGFQFVRELAFDCNRPCLHWTSPIGFHDPCSTPQKISMDSEKEVHHYRSRNRDYHQHRDHGGPNRKRISYSSF